MLEVVAVSSVAELPNAQRLRSLIAAAWPGIESAQADRITIGAGVRLRREIDLLVTIDLDEPRPTPAGNVYAAVLVIEVKALDLSCFEAVGNDLRPAYSGIGSNHTLLEQLDAQGFAVRELLDRYGERCFVHSLVWLTGANGDELREQHRNVSPLILAADATWAEMIAAAAGQNGAIVEPVSDERRAGVRALRNRLMAKRQLSSRDRSKLDRLTTEALSRDVVDDVVAKAGQAQVRLVGRAGSGKSTTLALAARRIFERDDCRLLFLTYHRALCTELEHLVTQLVRVAGASRDRVVVTTAFGFLEDAFVELGGTLTRKPDGKTDYESLPAAMEQLVAQRGVATLARDAAALRELVPARFDFDYVLVDEAQDWWPGQRDLLRVFFPPERTILADGLDQFAQGELRCDWTRDVAKTQQYARSLNRSLRMSANIACFVTGFARALGFNDWDIKPHAELVGGRVIIVSGAIEERPEIVMRLLELARESGASPGDCLVAVPPSHVQPGDGGLRVARIASVLKSAGVETWDGFDPVLRDTPRRPDALPLLAYASIRGLEGWATLLLGLDAWDQNRMKYPNTHSADISPDLVARRSLMTAVTRAAHILAIAVDDPASRVARTLAEAAAEMPAGVVEYW